MPLGALRGMKTPAGAPCFVEFVEFVAIFEGEEE
jgi:hypothetical protein